MKNSRYTAPRIKNAKGFTLIEMLMAMVIFSIGILAAGTMMVRSTSGNTVAGTITHGAEGASNRVENLLSSAYNHPDLNVGTQAPAATIDGLDNNYNGQIDEAGETGNLAISWTVQEVVPEAGTDIYNYKIVTVTVNWTRSGARTVVIQRAVPNIV